MTISEAEARTILSDLLSQLVNGIQSDIPVVDIGNGTKYVLSRGHSDEMDVLVLAVLSEGSSSEAEVEGLANEVASLLQKSE